MFHNILHNMKYLVYSPLNVTWKVVHIICYYLSLSGNLFTVILQIESVSIFNFKRVHLMCKYIIYSQLHCVYWSFWFRGSTRMLWIFHEGLHRKCHYIFFSFHHRLLFPGNIVCISDMTYNINRVLIGPVSRQTFAMCTFALQHVSVNALSHIRACKAYRTHPIIVD